VRTLWILSLAVLGIVSGLAGDALLSCAAGGAAAALLLCGGGNDDDEE
jgi:hypothetical protein